ncbi:hypothetical protein [Risungbinella massiliensis]|uniref:hypothetical protein n=1 Tax=Risungbinella massiliensis TaxID=1329796 RepID=UPI0005CBA8D3|nr:hypothetical protein [Risungbinella massiliensis]
MRNNYQLETNPLTDLEVLEDDFLGEEEPTPKWFTRPIPIMIIALICFGIYLVFRFFSLPTDLEKNQSPIEGVAINPTIPSTHAYQSKPTYVPEFAIQPSSSAIRQENQPDKAIKPTEEKKVASNTSKDPTPTNKKPTDKEKRSANIPPNLKHPSVQKDKETTSDKPPSEQTSPKPNHEGDNTNQTQDRLHLYKENRNHSTTPIDNSTFNLGKPDNSMSTLSSPEDSSQEVPKHHDPVYYLYTSRHPENRLQSSISDSHQFHSILIVSSLGDQILDWSDIKKTEQWLENIVELTLQNQNPAVYLAINLTIPNSVWQQLQNKLAIHHKVLGAVFTSTDHPDLTNKIASFQALGIQHFLFLPQEKTSLQFKVDNTSQDLSSFLAYLHSISFWKEHDQGKETTKARSSTMDPNDP